MLPHRFLQLPTTPRGEPYLPLYIEGERQIRPAVKGVIVSDAIASSISRTMFYKLFPRLKDWNQIWSPYIRMKPYFPQTELGKAHSAASARFVVVDDRVLPENDVIYLNPNLIKSMGELIRSREESKDIFQLAFPMAWAYRSSLLGLKSSGVLILGTDQNEGFWRMKAIQSEVDSGSLHGIVVRDLYDIHVQSIEEKMLMFATACLFVVIEHTFPSGAIDELRICTTSRVTTCILKESGHGATWMQSDYELDYKNIKEFTYTMNPLADDYLPWVVQKAVNWATRERLKNKADELNLKYPWRVEQRILEEMVLPSYDTQAMLQFWEQLVGDVKETIRLMNLEMKIKRKMYHEAKFEERITVTRKELLLTITAELFSKETRAMGTCKIVALHHNNPISEEQVLLGTSPEAYKGRTPFSEKYLLPGPLDNYLITKEGLQAVTQDTLKMWLEEVITRCDMDHSNEYLA